jgi:hypothetical protein
MGRRFAKSEAIQPRVATGQFRTHWSSTCPPPSTSELEVAKLPAAPVQQRFGDVIACQQLDAGAIDVYAKCRVAKTHRIAS